MTQEFSFPGLTLSQNELDGKHWTVKHAQKEYWHQMVWAVARTNVEMPGWAHVHILRVSKRLIDPLNVYAGLKWLLDGLVQQGWLRGDAYDDLEITADQRKCEKGEEPHMEVHITYSKRT